MCVHLPGCFDCEVIIMYNPAFLKMKKRLATAAKASKTPLIGHFELTPRCNLDCKMCYVHNQDSNSLRDKELTTEQWKHIFDEAIEMGMMFATFTGGECLLREDFKELYLYLYNKHVMVSVMTNGTLINDNYIEFFKNNRPESVQISIYGSDESGYLQVTGHRGFEKATRAAVELQNAGIHVRITVTPSRYIKEDYVATVRACKEKGLTVILGDLTLMQNRDNPEKDDYFLTEDEIFELSKGRMELYKELIPVECTPEPGGPEVEQPGTINCNAGNCLATVSWDGKMYACINLMVGGADVREVGYAEAWRQVVEATSKVMECVECTGCAYKKACSHCPVFRLNGLYSGHCNPDVCKMTRRLVEAGVKKLGISDNIEE